MRNPAKEFPRSVFLAILIIVAVYALGTLVIEVVVPSQNFYPFDWQIEGHKPSQASKWAAGYEPMEQEAEDAETGAIAAHATG